MSWFIGMVSKQGVGGVPQDERINNNLNRITGNKPQLKMQNNNAVLWGGGLDETFISKWKEDPGISSGWVVCGIGIRSESGSAAFMQKDDWAQLLDGEADPSRIFRTNGHYAICKWSEDEFQIFCDPFELRRAYVAETNEYFIFSTRLDWLAALFKSPKLSESALAGSWMLVNSFSDQALIRNVVRAGASGHIKLKKGTLTHTWHHWLPENASRSNNILQLLKSMALLPIYNGHKLTLGLSGGMDSRTMLSILSMMPTDKWRIHSCGDGNNLDVVIANRLAEHLKINRTIKIQDISENDTVDSVVGRLREYALYTEMTDSLFGYPRLQLFKELHDEGYWMIDGGFGELLRRSYGNKLFLAGQDAIVKKNTDVLLPFFSYHRANIFNEEMVSLLKKESRIQLEVALQSMTEDPKRDIGNWIDLLHIRYRLKNYPANGQAIYDEYIASYMPFAQQDVISAYLNVPSRSRTDNKINRTLIKNCTVDLTNIPLVASGVVVPFWTSKNVYLQRLYAKIIKKTAPRQLDPAKSFPHQLLFYLQEYILDRIHSQKIRTCPYYSIENVEKNIEKYYSGDESVSTVFLEDWLTFDFWREHLDNNDIL